jgi:hypothetical protein
VTFVAAGSRSTRSDPTVRKAQRHVTALANPHRVVVEFIVKESIMPERWLGIVVSGDTVTVVDAEVPKTGPLELQSDQSWSLQGGDRASAYDVMYRRVRDYILEHGIARTIIKASALSQRSVRLGHLASAELRGVVMCAAAASAVQCLAKNFISRRFGSRKVDEYVKDTVFWDANVVGNLRAGSREAAMMLLAARGK